MSRWFGGYRIPLIALLVFLVLAFIIIIWTSAIEATIGGLLILIVLAIVIVFLYYIFMMSKEVKFTLATLSETIQHMIDNNPKNTFSQLEDTILSKLQNQMLQLMDILKSHSIKQKREKDEITALISDISHQLKTPLANLNVYNSLLLDKGLSEDKRAEFIISMQKQLEKLNWLIESLIKMSRLETGIIKLKAEGANIGDTLLQAIKMISIKAEERNIHIKLQMKESFDLFHDRKWTEEAIFNILDNAVKYSPVNKEITVSLIRYQLFCRIDVEDKGNGFTEDEINKLFTRFYRGANTKDVEGLGLGLYLSRRIIQGQGGFIKAKSHPGKGSVFSIFLPL